MNVARVRLLAALSVALLLAGCGLSLYAATALSRESPVEASLAAGGFSVRRSAAGPLDALSLAQPQSIVLVEPPALLDAERAALKSFVEEGGALWIVSLHPEGALWPELAGAIKVLPGAIYGGDGGSASYLVAGGGETFSRGRMQAVLVDGVEATPLARSMGSAVRDTNGDGVLQAGEPTGPFVVATRVAVGQGQVLIVTAQPVPPEDDTIPYARLGPVPPGGAVVSDYAHPGAWAKPVRTVLAMLAAVPAVWWLDALLALVVAAALLVLATTSQPAAPKSQKPAELVRSLEEALTAASVPRTHPFWLTLEEKE